VHRDPRNAAPLATMRVAMATRSRYAEGRLVEAARRGVAQYVLLGAGLDSFAYSSPLAQRLDVFEVDQPAHAGVQARAAGMAVLDDVGRREQIDASLWSRSDALVPHRLGRVVHARGKGAGKGFPLDGSRRRRRLPGVTTDSKETDR
jgi:hypothetical protein